MFSFTIKIFYSFPQLRHLLSAFVTSSIHLTTRTISDIIIERVIITMSDFDKLLRHTDFRTVLQLADMLRYQKAKLENRRGHEGLQPIYASSSPSQTRKKKSAFGGSRSEISQIREVGIRESSVYDNAAELLRVSLLPPSNSGSIALKRGECIITDSLIDETIESLADELRFYLDIMKQRVARRGSQVSGPISNEGDALDTKRVWVGAGANAVDEKRNPVADKFSKLQTDLLTDWMIAHKVRVVVSTLPRFASLQHSLICVHCFDSIGTPLS